MSRPDSPLPSQLRVVGATDLERRLLEASARELPSVELTQKMRQALGISLAAGAATAATAAAANAAPLAGTGSAAPGLVWPAISVGVLALAVTGAVVGVRASATHRALPNPAAAIAAPAAIGAPPSASPAAPPDVSEAAAPVAVTPHRAIATRAQRHASPIAMPGDLRAEIALVDAARNAVAGGANDRALSLLGRYDASYPHGTFRPEVAALRIEALAHAGRTAQARALGQKFIAAHADSPLADRVARVTDLSAR